MNLEDVVDPEYGLQQDEYSLSSPCFGPENKLMVVGWNGRKGTHKFYILTCSACSQDPELFGEGYFKSTKGSLVGGSLPCGCSKKPEWSKDQYAVLCSRKAKELGYTFVGFTGEWKGVYTKVKMLCEKHGEWGSGIIHNLISAGNGCPECVADIISKASTKPDEMMIQSFMDSGYFASGSKFWRSDRETKRGRKVYWFVSCGECGLIGESPSNNLRRGCRPCACSNQRQQEAYINLLTDSNGVVAIKFGITRDSRRRIKQQDSASAYTIKQHSVYRFPSVEQCKKAERECKKELECGVVLKRDMPSGYTETTWVYNLEKIEEIYKRNGGVKE